ncbi:MAG: VWA domain-containing protein [Polyangiaceae bacterium]|nr:VWA domain-containing protein [Polyangiaceae bacterium]
MRFASPLVLWALLVGLTACSRHDSGDGDDSGDGTDGSGAGTDGSGANGSGANGSGANGSGANGSGANGSGADGSAGSGNSSSDSAGSGNQGSGADGSGANGSEDDSVVDDPECEAQSIAAEVAPAAIMLVVDTSFSMTDRDFPSTNGLSKWAATQQALREALQAMPPQYAVGLIFFPNTPQTTPPPCFVENLVEIAPLTDEHLADLDDAMANHDAAGYTPTQEAWKYAYNELQAWSPDDPLYESAERYIVVITDGVPTRGNECEMPPGRVVALARSQYMPLIEAADDAFINGGIGTFVIGSPGSEDDTQGNLTYDSGEDYIAREMLSAFAIAGGTAREGCSNSGAPYCHFDMTTETDFVPALVATLGTIAQSVVSCTYTIPEPSTVNVFLDHDPDTFTVEYYPNGASSPENLTRVAEGKACTEGWQLSEDETQIELCPDTCTRVKADPFAAIQVHFRCVTPQ